LYVLPAGSIVENALEVLSSPRFRELITRLSAACDIVIIDSPPTQLVSDAIVLSQMATGVVFVLKARATPYPLARRSIKGLQDAGANILGVALNQLDFKMAQRYHGGYTGYGSEHGARYGNAVQA
jgi:Mrp family chromosome partitioning ATPase